MLKLRFCVGDLDLPERANTYTSSRVDEDSAQSRPCGNANESRTRQVARCELYKEERNVKGKDEEID